MLLRNNAETTQRCCDYRQLHRRWPRRRSIQHKDAADKVIARYDVNVCAFSTITAVKEPRQHRRNQQKACLTNCLYSAGLCGSLRSHSTHSRRKVFDSNRCLVSIVLLRVYTKFHSVKTLFVREKKTGGSMVCQPASRRSQAGTLDFPHSKA